MEVKMAKCAGFCFGVKRAVDTVYEQINLGKKIYTYGPIVHNDTVVNDLIDLGVKVIADEGELRELLANQNVTDNLNDINSSSMGTIVIRAHGIPKRIQELIENSNFEYVDLTCPFVKRIHNIVAKESSEGKHIIVVGSKIHPEVEGIVGWCEGPVSVIENAEDAQAFEVKKNDELCIVSQTTYNYNKFEYIVEIFEKKGYNGSVVNTICNATEERQQAAMELAKEADVMIVIGGKHSSNSTKLYEICKKECANTLFLQTLDDLHLDVPKAVRLVGITAGASTPNKLIEEVQNYVRINF